MSVAPRGDAGVCAWPSPGLCNQARGRGGGVAAWASCGCGLAGRLVDGRLEAEGPVGKEGRVVCMRLGLRAEAPESKGQCGEPVPFADGELSWARVPTSPPAKRPQILRLAQPSSAGTYCAWCAPHQSSAGTTSRRCRPRSGTSVGRPQPCSCPGSSPPPAGARRVWRTPLEPTSALGCISAMACQGHQGSPSSSWPLRDVSSNGNSPPQDGGEGRPSDSQQGT